MKSAIKGKGFTLIELLIVIIIIGILATLAIPQYTKMVEKARTGEAKTILGSMRTAQELYYAERAKYTNSLGDIDDYVEVPSDASVEHYFTYHVSYIGVDPQTFNVYGTRKTSGGKSPAYGTNYNIALYHNGGLYEGGP